MDRRHKDLLRTVVGDLRRTLAGGEDARGEWVRGDLDRELERLGIAPDGTVTAPDSATATPAERRAHEVARVALAGRSPAEAAAARQEVVERAAHTWTNRLLALRAMEARGLIDETLRTRPDYGGVSEALYLLRQEAPARCASPDGGWWAVVEDACAARARALPGLFDLSDPIAALRPSPAALVHCVQVLGNAPSGYSIEESDAAFADPDAIGWAYQFYQEPAKARVYARLSKGGKVSSRSDIAAVTQLFTEPYMVKWLLQNSLGRTYHELHPDSRLPERWEYYIRERPNGDQPPPEGWTLESLTFMDPAAGSGHILRESFDLLFAMYREQKPELGAREIADRILRHHLFGIDIDPRAAQLAALTLYLRAWEMVRDEARAKRRADATDYAPPPMNIATTPSRIPPGALERHLARHPQDAILRPVLEGLFAELEQASVLGSLLQPGERLDEAIRALQAPQLVMDFDPEVTALRQSIRELAFADPAGLRQHLLDRVATSFAADAGSRDDVSAALFGHDAVEGVRLVQLLGRRYAVVSTNPPYMSAGSLTAPVKEYVDKHYKPGKRDLYAAFILRCLGLCQPAGRVAMVTQQSWMFLESFAALRAVSDNRLASARQEHEFTGLLRETSIEALAHLGPHAFDEITGEVVQCVLFTLGMREPGPDHKVVAWRLVGLPSAAEKAHALVSRGGVTSATRGMLALANAPILYWLGPRVLDLLSGTSVSHLAVLAEPTTTGDNRRFFRTHWEVASDARWSLAARGGGHCKWYGLTHWTIESEHHSARIKAFPGSYIRNEHLAFAPGLTYTEAAAGSLSTRLLIPAQTFAKSGPGVFAADPILPALLLILNSHTASYILRSTARSFMFGLSSIGAVPLVVTEKRAMAAIAKACTGRKHFIRDSDIAEYGYRSECTCRAVNVEYAIAAVLHTCEAVGERMVLSAYQLPAAVCDRIVSETGTPAGFHPLMAGYDALPELPPELGLPPLPAEVIQYLDQHDRIHPSPADLARIKANLRTLYEAGPGAKEVELDDAPGGSADAEGERPDDDAEDHSAIAPGAYIPIPTETFLEELSVKLKIHPISVYWLLEELRAEGVRCKPEELRLLEDRLSVLVLRLLGHRWPRQIEAGEPLPEWADADGVIPLTAGLHEPTIADRVRLRLRAEDGDLGAQQAESLLTELTGLELGEWLRRRFFPRHVRQFKYRPIAWHLASRPATGSRKAGGSRTPAFECLLYYHRSSREALARIRSVYVEPIAAAERQRREDARKQGDETAAAIAGDRLQELADFAERLRQVEEAGFACAELDEYVAAEPLDRWSGDGRSAPESREALLRQERAWHVDINDGVRVNIAPLQLAGLLAGDVLKAKDARQAIADRARLWADPERSGLGAASALPAARLHAGGHHARTGPEHARGLPRVAARASRPLCGRDGAPPGGAPGPPLVRRGSPGSHDHRAFGRRAPARGAGPGPA